MLRISEQHLHPAEQSPNTYDFHTCPLDMTSQLQQHAVVSGYRCQVADTDSIIKPQYKSHIYKL